MNRFLKKKKKGYLKLLRKQTKNILGHLGRDRVYVTKITRIEPVPYYFTIVGQVKDEIDYIEEWIDFHSLVGCEHFYIYDNNSSDGTTELLKAYESRKVLTRIPWPDSTLTSQAKAYAHALSTFGPGSRWMMFMDVDEFAFPTASDTIQQELTKYEDLPALGLQWHMFGTSGHRQRPPGLVIENYTVRSKVPHPTAPPAISIALRKFKSIVDPTRIRAPGIHRFFTDEGEVVYTLQRKALSGLEWKMHTQSSDDNIVLNHYYTRSAEEFERKLAKGSISRKERSKRKARAEAIESAPIEDLRIQRFIPRLKSFQSNKYSREIV